MSTTTKPPDPQPALRLARFRVDTGHAIGIGPPFHSMGLVDCANPPANIEGWSVAIRGAAVFFVSPPGWQQGRSIRELTGRGPLTVIGPIPLQHVTLVWEGDPQGVDKLQRVDVPPLARVVVPSEAPGRAIDSKELGDP